MADNDKGQALDWDVTEVVDDGGFTLLPAGTYAFEVAKIERERFEGSDKMEACPRAKVTLNVWTSQGWAPVVDRLMLNTKMAWRIARFFEGLGFGRDPQTGSVKIDWNAAVGKQGYVKIKVRDYQSNGETRQANDIDAYLKPCEWPTEQQAAAPEQTSLPVAPQQAAPRPHSSYEM